MGFISIVVLTVGVIGVGLAQRSQKRRTGQDVTSIGMPAYGYLFILISLIGWYLCIKEYGWMGLIPIVVSMVFGRMAATAGAE